MILDTDRPGGPAVGDFIESCEVAWLTRDTKPAALELEGRMKREWRPPLTEV